jgi:SNF2 family DNA or RNA helicase
VPLPAREVSTAVAALSFDPWWNPAVQAQATDRAHRIGQTQPVFVYNLVVAGSVEERMLAAGASGCSRIACSSP